MRLNELAEVWRELAGVSGPWGGRFDEGQFAGRVSCAIDLEDRARRSWKPVSEPPTEADGDEHGSVMLWHPGKGLYLAHYSVFRIAYDDGGKWARVRDVVLLPEGEGE